MRLITTFVLIVLLVLLVLLRLYFSLALHSAAGATEGRRPAYAALSSIARSAKEEAPFHLSSLIIHHSPRAARYGMTPRLFSSAAAQWTPKAAVM